jgi:hypothetical protein
MATVKHVKEAIDICRKAGISLFVWGHRGLGKSSIIRQYAASNNIGFVDLRCSQLESSDIRGLPEAFEGKTRYLPPADMPVGGMSHDEIVSQIKNISDDTILKSQLKKLQPFYNDGILFLDEVNRAQDDVLQSIFELILDRSIGQYVLPDGWNIVAAGNFMEGYITNGFNDAAFLDRFCHVTLSGGDSTLSEWIDYMTSMYGELASDVIEFASYNVDNLDGKIDGELGFSIQPSRRSWEMLNKVSIISKQHPYTQEAILEVYSGLVGRDLAISFLKYSCPVKPRDLLSDVINRHIKKLNQLQRNQLCGLMWGLVAFCKNKIDQDDVASVCIDFAKYMLDNNREKDLVVAFCRALMSEIDLPDHVKSATISNPNLAKLMSKFNAKINTNKNFIDKLTEVPSLQQALSNVSWGIE